MGAFSNMDYELQNSEAAVSDAFTEDDAKTIPKQIHFDAAYAGNAFDTVPYRSLCRGYGG